MNNEIIYKYEPLWGNWKIDKLIGSGSIGKVYKIYREDFNKKYVSAVKVISIPNNDQYESFLSSSGDTSKEFTKQYFKNLAKNIVSEIDLLYKLKGNNSIINYEDHMILNEDIYWHIFIRMEYSISLKEYIKTNVLSIDDIIKLGIDICSALEVCHREGIIHRDIKEDNLFISPNSNLYKLGDFSVSKEMSVNTYANTKVGTINYMPPEILKGEQYKKDVDLYCLGIVLYKLLNHGRLPFMPYYPLEFSPNDVEQSYIKRISGKKLLPPVNGSESINDIILKACSFKQNDRFESATEMKNALKDIVHKLSINLNEPYNTSNLTASTTNYNNSTINNNTVDIFSPKNNSANNSSNPKNLIKYKKPLLILAISTLIFFLIGILFISKTKSVKNYSNYLKTKQLTLNTKNNNIFNKIATFTFIETAIPSNVPILTPSNTPSLTNTTKTTPTVNITPKPTKTLQTTGKNLIRNSGAESSSLIWLEYFGNNSEGSSVISSDYAKSGNNSFKITKTNSSSFHTFYERIYTYRFGARFLFSAYVKVDSKSSSSLESGIDLHYVQNNNKLKSTTAKTPPNSTNWTYISTIIDTPPDIPKDEPLTVYLSISNGIGTVYFDDIRVEEIIE